MKLYSWEEIKKQITCIDAAQTILNLTIKDGRCAATWRGGTNQQSVAINETGWHDHKTKESGSVLDLVSKVMFDNDFLLAQQFLGDRFNLPYKEKQADPSTRHAKLLREGYTETAQYKYTDESGQPILKVYRLEHPDPDKKKQFLQQDAGGRWSVKHLDPVLYNLPGIINSPAVFIVEGEKDANTLIARGLPATTNSGGSSKWSLSFSEYFKGKDVAILYDNDISIPKGKTEPVGIAHAKVIAASLLNVAKTVRMVKTSDSPKGDVTDYFSEGHSVDQLYQLVNSAAPLKSTDLAGIEPEKLLSAEVQIAKEANKYEFKNFFPQKKDNGNGKTSIHKEPVHINKLVEECHKRFLSFPRKVGEQLFDHDRESGNIFYMRKASTLFSWMARKSCQRVNWSAGDSLVNKDEFFEAIKAEGIRYESISSVPDWPRRTDVYYSHDQLPEADGTGQYLDKLVSFFRPSSGFEIPLKAFVAAPLLYREGIDRPMWVITSDQPGAGKSTLANIVSALYGHPPIEVKKNEFAKDMQKVTERCLSSAGRLRRMMLIDNLIGNFSSDALSGMLTMPHISGKAPYGHGEETRPNNLTYVITGNDINLDNDLSIRAYWLNIKAIENYSFTWKTELIKFINDHRLNIISDIIHLLSNHEPFKNIEPITRVPEFEVEVLQACCNDIDEYSDVVKLMIQSRSNANIEADLAKQIEDDFRSEIADLEINPEEHSVWIHSAVIDEWIRKLYPFTKQNPLQMIKNLTKAGHCTRFNPKIDRYPHNGNERRRGIMWLNNSADAKPSFTIFKQGKKVKKVTAKSDSGDGLI